MTTRTARPTTTRELALIRERTEAGRPYQETDRELGRGHGFTRNWTLRLGLKPRDRAPEAAASLRRLMAELRRRTEPDDAAV